MMLNHPYWKNLEKGTRDEAAEWEKREGLDIEVVVTDAKEDPKIQIPQIRNLISRNADAVVLVPTKPEPLVDGVLELNRKNIPVIIVNREVGEGCEYVAYCGTDTYQGAVASAEILMEAIGGEGEVAELQQVLGSGPQILRSKALREVIARHPKVKLVASVPHEMKRTVAIAQTQAMLQSYPKLAGLFAHGDLYAVAAADAAQQRRRKLAVVGVGGSTEGIKAVREGRLVGTSWQQPYQEGRMGVRLALRHLRGDKLEKRYPIQCDKITKANADKVEGQF